MFINLANRYFPLRYWPDFGAAMSTHIARNDALVVSQVTTLTPTVVNSGVYKVSMNTKVSGTYTADGSATATEVVEGLQAVLDAESVSEIAEVTWTEDNTKVIATGSDTGEPFTVVDASISTAALTVSTTTNSKSPNHWIAENFSSGSLPANGDTVIITKLSSDQGFKWNLDQSAVSLLLLDIRADNEAPIGLSEIHESGYYQTNYRNTHLVISASKCRIGDGNGNGASRIKLNFGSNACDLTVFKTSYSKDDPDEAPVHILGSHASNALQLIQGEVDIAMLPGYTAQWPMISCSGGVLRCGLDVTLGVVEAAGNSYIETRSDITTLRTRDNGSVTHTGNGDIGTLDIAGGTVSIRATSPLTITLLKGYGGRELDLTNCDSVVTITDMDIYGSPSQPFTIRDPNNKLSMTNAASTPNGVQSLVVYTGSNRSILII